MGIRGGQTSLRLVSVQRISIRRSTIGFEFVCVGLIAEKAAVTIVWLRTVLETDKTKQT